MHVLPIVPFIICSSLILRASLPKSASERVSACSSVARSALLTQTDNENHGEKRKKEKENGNTTRTLDHERYR